jgi:DNA invertase Pin-like site-specific DNA recombinase
VRGKIFWFKARLMKLADINTQTLSALLSLTKKKETLLAKVEAVEKQIASLASGETREAIRVLRAKKARRGRKPGTKKTTSSGKRAPKGLLKEQITSILNAAGEAGSSVKEIAEKVGKPIQHIYVWFSGTGKKLGMFDKMGEGKYRIKPAQH